MTVLSLVPTAQQDKFGALPSYVKQEASNWLQAIRALDAAGDKTKEAAAQASRLGVAVKTVFTKRSDFRARGWLALINHAKAGEAWWSREREANLPPAAIKHLRKLCDQNQRCSAPAIRAFLRQWRRWKLGDQTARIPGYETCPEGGDHPPGWSARNLARFLPSKFDLAAMRRGLHHAVGTAGPRVFTTRARLHYLSHIMLDDVWHDHFVVWQRKGICRVVELDALDVFSGALLFWGCKPRLKREDGTFDQKLARYVPLCLAAVFANEGYSPRGTQIMAEHGAAAVPERLKAMFRDYFPEHLSVRESGITGEEQAIIGWRGQGKGNSRFKSCLESHHNLKHNELAALPGQTGSRRDTRPEFTHGILQADSDLLQAMQVLQREHPARAAQLQTRLLDYHSAFLPLLIETYRVINERDWHTLEGWDDIPGNVQIEYRLAPTSDAWLSDAEFRRLPQASQEALLLAVAQDPRYIRRRRLSPSAVQRRERGALLQMPDWAIADMIGPEFAREMKVAGAYFDAISDEEISTAPLRYESVVLGPSAQRCQLPDDTYWCVLNPFDPGRLFVHDGRQRFLGVAARVTRLDASDKEQLALAYRHQARRLKELTAPLVQRHAAAIREEIQRVKNNADVLAGEASARAAARARAEQALANATTHYENPV